MKITMIKMIGNYDSNHYDTDNLDGYDWKGEHDGDDKNYDNDNIDSYN